MRKKFSNKKILVGICASIAAYKTCELIRSLVSEGASVYVLVTKNALHFVTSLTLKTLSGHPVIENIFDEEEFDNIMHVQVAHWADLIVISPATANIIGKVAHGIADDIVSTTLLATRSPVIFAPAMNDQMYMNTIFQENLKKLKAHGYHFVEPESGYLACGYEGIGRLASQDAILKKIESCLKKVHSR
ncbi:MAG: bifunctional phosphopantothenoylcysteine decarboxylase/phosphopantothenate--cysteine ligase CoaBC [Chlamydiae bacterium]|nr:bifunctional phosphopantothenoylcysteine decarboxylase/phosphopantothenate--cysteine ligase CoaBC [Chlamydiota bacterium]MBI3266103.1 bifunctional phosphopantothenoylcysteine decarboxylase/phosphopantothenate--cysteine ligase CoaBC [Chlamydiota bacterium]